MKEKNLTISNRNLINFMITFTSDILKISNKSILDEGEQCSNIDWLECLLRPILESLTSIKINNVKALKDNQGVDRLSIYGKIGIAPSIEGWINLYEGELEQDAINIELDKYYIDTYFAISFETPGYLINYFNSRNIKFLDLTISPIRFLDDYIFSLRSNDVRINNLIQMNVLGRHAYIPYIGFIRGLAARKIRDPNHGPLFIGQMDIDASLIQNQRIPDLEDLRSVLERIILHYGEVHYKAHPHNKNINELKELVKSIRGCKWLERNMYDTLGGDNWDSILSFSSGAIEEAALFGKKVTRLLQKNWHYEDLNNAGGNRSHFCYKNIENQKLFSSSFWREILNAAGVETIETTDLIYYTDLGVKTSLNIRWAK